MNLSKKKTIKKASIVVLSLALCVFPVSAYAWGWGLPIHPGDHVFDAKRWADSVKVYTQKMQEVMNQVQKYQDMIIMNSGVIGLDQRVNSAIERYSDAYLGTSFINPDADISDAVSSGQSVANMKISNAQELTEFKEKLHRQSVTSNIDTITSFQKNMENASNKLTQIAAVLNTQTGNERGGSIVGETQKANAIRSIRSSTAVDAARSEGAEMMNRIENQQTQIANEHAERIRGSVAKVPSFDPYNPTDEEKAAFESSSKNVGFGSFNGGE